MKKCLLTDEEIHEVIESAKAKVEKVHADLVLEVTRSERYLYINAYLDGERIGKLGVDFEVEYSRFANYCVGDKLAKIVYVFTNESYGYCGVATKMLRKVVEELKGYNLYLDVIPTIRKHGLSKYQTVKGATQGLVEFYGKFGFRKVKESCATTMFRKSNSPLPY